MNPLRRLLPCVLVLGVALSAHAETAPTASAVALPAASALPPLPEMPVIRKAEAEPDAAKEVEALLSRLVSDKEDVRLGAVKALATAREAWVPAVRGRIAELRQDMSRDASFRVLEQARKEGRKGGRAESVDDPKTDKAPTKGKKKRKKAADKDKAAQDKAAQDKAAQDKAASPSAVEDDWLMFVLAQPDPDKAAWRDMVHLLGCIRILRNVGTTPAVRELIELRSNFGEGLRLDLQRQLEALGDRAVPALIEARKHEAVVVQRFAELLLDKLGRAIPGEAVAAEDPDVLADVLRAFGRTRDVDAVRVALSFANSDRRKVRDAARQAITAIGDPGKWQLREAYQDIVGEKPAKNIPWDTLAKQIFYVFDHARLAELDKLATEGAEALKANDAKKAVQLFDRVLAQDPLFDRRKDMVPAYLEVARATPPEEGEAKLALYRKAARLDPQRQDKSAIESEIAFAEAQLLMKDGRPDRFLLERAVALNPGNADAKAALDAFEERAIAEDKPKWPRFAAAGGILAGTAVLLAGVALLFRRKAVKLEPPTPPPAGA